MYDYALSKREMMIESLANFDEELADQYLDGQIESISSQLIDRAIAKAASSMRAVPLLCGSALKNKGV